MPDISQQQVVSQHHTWDKPSGNRRASVDRSRLCLGRDECFVYLVEDVVEAGLVEKPYEFLRGKVRNIISHDPFVYLNGFFRGCDGFFTVRLTKAGLLL